MKKTFRVPDMYCPSCPMHLEALEDELTGVRYISASYKKLSLEIDFDENLISVDQIISAVNELGYHPEPATG